MFNQVPLVDISNKQYTIKIPMIYTEDIESYKSYLQAWVKRQEKIMEQWVELLDDLFATCARIPKADAEKLLQDLNEEKNLVNSQKATMSMVEYEKLMKSIDKETKNMQKIIEGNEILESDATFGEDIQARRTRATANVKLTAQRISALPIYTVHEKFLLGEKKIAPRSFIGQKQEKLDRVTKRKEALQACASVTSNLDSFLKFQANI
jgi:hypothetical protein